ncbi:MAG: ribosome-associated translation inhibitor RaiA [Patescibacteria group bacterium]
MKINIVTKDMDPTEAIASYVNEKVGSLKKFIKEGGKEPMADVEVGKTTKHHQKGDVFRTEINMTIDGGFMRTESIKDDLYASIDEARDEMMRELVKRKEKGESLWKRGAMRIKRMMRGEQSV